MLVAELLFGRDINAAAAVSDADWQSFVDTVVAKEFPGGFTILDADGAWRAAARGTIIHERSKVVIIAAAPTAETASRLQSLADAYRTWFGQDSVGIVTTQNCAAF
jgi:hypothetical protein